MRGPPETVEYRHAYYFAHYAGNNRVPVSSLDQSMAWRFVLPKIDTCDTDTTS